MNPPGLVAGGNNSAETSHQSKKSTEQVNGGTTQSLHLQVRVYLRLAAQVKTGTGGVGHGCQTSIVQQYANHTGKWP